MNTELPESLLIVPFLYHGPLHSGLWSGNETVYKLIMHRYIVYETSVIHMMI